METKTCSKCKADRPVSDFCKEKRVKCGLQARCKECTNTHNRERRKREDVKQQDAEYRRQYAARDPEKERARVHEWREANRGKFQEQCKRHHANNREERNAQAIIRTRKHYAANPEAYKAHVHTRRARKLQNGGTFTGKQWTELKEACQQTCLRCGRKAPDVLLTPDHVIPIVKGGSNDISNIQVLCRSCNCSKRANTTDYRK